MLRAAVNHDLFQERAAVIVHTDTPALSYKGMPVFTRPLPCSGQWFEIMSACHRSVLYDAAVGDVVVLLTADMVLSTNALASCKRAFAQGRKLVCCNATRAVLEEFKPFTRDGRMLSEWGWQHRHKMTGDITWPNGTSDDLHRVYFESSAGVVTRQTMPHPLAVKIDGRPLDFSPTIDCDLTTCFRREEIHLVTSPDDLAVVELSPREKAYPSRDAREPPERMGLPPMSERYASKEIQHRLYSWLLAHRITVSGVADGCSDDEAVEPLLTRYRAA
jgi:hypothetical protein